MQGKQVSEQKLKALMQSREGQKLLQLLNSNGGHLFQKAAAAAESGDYQAVLKTLRPVLETKEAATLLQELQKKHG